MYASINMMGSIYLSFVIHILDARFLSLLLGSMLSYCTLIMAGLMMMNNTDPIRW